MVDVFIKDLKDCKEFIAGDNTTLCELLHPDKEDIKIHYSLAYAVLKPDKSSFSHRLKSAEVYYILEGKGVMFIDGESEEVHGNQVIYIPPNSTQYIKNTGKCDLKFLCIVDPPWKKEDEEVL